MNSFHDPHVDIMASAAVSAPPHLPVMVTFWHSVNGLYIWEYFTTLDYEWKVIRGRLPYRWTIWIYSFSRLAALLSVILSFVSLDVTTPINCQLSTLFAMILLCLSSATASLLIVLRTIAIWNRKRAVVALAMTVLGTSIGFHFNNIVRAHFAWISARQACGRVSPDSAVLGFIPTIVADIALLLIIFAGLFVLRRGNGKYGLTRLLWRQGVIWLVLGATIEIPSLVFTVLNLNGPLRYVLENPSLIVMIIAATRMHRSLVDFASGSTEITRESRPMSNLVFSKTKRSDSAPTALDRVEVATHKAFGQHSTGSKNDDDSSTVTGTGELALHTGGDPPPKLDLTQVSGHPLPAVSPSPTPEAQSV